MPLTDDERQRLQSLANRATSTDPAGGNIQVQPNAPSTNAWDPQGFAASGGTKSVQERQAAPAPQQPAAPAAQPAAAGGMGGRLTDSWNTFIDHPENRAGLMQFAVNMLSGKGLGESIGAGAEATGRSVTSQQEAERLDEAQALREQEAARKERETDYYGIMARKKSGADTYYEHLSAQGAEADRRAGEAKFDAWMSDALPDAKFQALQARHPELKRKADLWDEKNKTIREEARGMFRGGEAAAAPKPQFTPPAGAQKRYDKNGNEIYFDPKTKQPYPGQI